VKNHRQNFNSEFQCSQQPCPCTGYRNQPETGIGIAIRPNQQFRHAGASGVVIGCGRGRCVIHVSTTCYAR